tara:strand:+ start:881 stop:1351 length:471 start_codon:yes stop_codon:yes gene_type:complete
MAKITTNKNFLSPVGFKLVIDTTKFANTEYFCTSVSLPGISLGDVQVPYKGVNLAMTGDRMMFEDLAIRFNITENMENYIEIYNWMHDIINTGASEDMKYDARLMILSSHNNVSKQIKFQSLFPTSLSAVAFDAQQSDVEYAQADITFKYTYFEFD